MHAYDLTANARMHKNKMRPGIFCITQTAT